MRPNPSLSLLLQQGLQARRAGQFVAAQMAFTEVLKRHPEQPDALLMLGELAQSQGRPALAEEFFARALKVDPLQFQAWARRASLLEDMGRPVDAELCYRKAAEIRPDHAESLYNRARLLRQIGRTVEAEQSLALALLAVPGSPTLRAQMLQLRALLEEEAGQLELALATIEQAIGLAPGRAALHHNRGVLLQRLVRPTEALAAHDLALQLGLVAADAHYNRGNSLQSLGRSDDALLSYRCALALDPLHALALYDIARLRWRLGDAAFSAELDAAATLAPGSAVAHGIKARLLLRAERYAEAAEAFTHAAALAVTVAGYFDGLGQSLSRLGRHDEALVAYCRAIELAPDQSATHIGHASGLLQAGQVAKAAQVAQEAVRLSPLDQQAWALLGLAWRAGGEPQEAWLNDYRRYVQVFDLSPPSGWADMLTFNRALAALLEQLHTDAQAPIDQTLRHGSQTMGNIFEQSHPLLQQLKGRIAEAVDRYVAYLGSLARDDAHPLLGRSSNHWRFTDSWSSRLRSRGFHTPHVHPHGWISSCYYVALPEAIGADGADSEAGWISFGAPDISVPGCDLSAQLAVKPRVGRLVLFPSFMWHGTVPFTGVQPRLTVAFDLMPPG